MCLINRVVIASGSAAVVVHGRTVNEPNDGISLITRIEIDCRATARNDVLSLF